MDFELNGRVAIITGCSVGIGREVAKVLAGEGVQTVVIARRGALLQTLQDEIVAAGGPAHAMALDRRSQSRPSWRRPWPTSATSISLLTMRAAPRPRADAPDEVWEESGPEFHGRAPADAGLLAGHADAALGPSSILRAHRAVRHQRGQPCQGRRVHVWAKGSRVVGRDGITVNCLAPAASTASRSTRRIHPTEESQRAFAAQTPRLLRGSSGHGLPGNLSVLDESAVPHGRAHPVDGATGAPTGRAPRTRAWLNPMRPYRALAGCRLGRSSRRGGCASPPA